MSFSNSDSLFGPSQFIVGPSLGSATYTSFAAAILAADAAGGEGGRGHVRACFATSYQQLITACDRIERFVAKPPSKRLKD